MAAFWLGITSFAAYTAMIGYTIEDEADTGLRTLVAFAVAMALHFVVNDYGLREHHKARYGKVGRSILAGSVLAGWILSQLAEPPRRRSSPCSPSSPAESCSTC